MPAYVYRSWAAVTSAVVSVYTHRLSAELTTKYDGTHERRDGETSDEHAEAHARLVERGDGGCRAACEREPRAVQRAPEEEADDGGRRADGRQNANMTTADAAPMEHHTRITPTASARTPEPRRPTTEPACRIRSSTRTRCLGGRSTGRT